MIVIPSIEPITLMIDKDSLENMSFIKKRFQ